jgi:hypothetical protein
MGKEIGAGLDHFSVHIPDRAKSAALLSQFSVISASSGVQGAERKRGRSDQRQGNSPPLAFT